MVIVEFAIHRVLNRHGDGLPEHQAQLEWLRCHVHLAGPEWTSLINHGINADTGDDQWISMQYGRTLTRDKFCSWRNMVVVDFARSG